MKPIQINTCHEQGCTNLWSATLREVSIKTCKHSQCLIGQQPEAPKVTQQKKNMRISCAHEDICTCTRKLHIYELEMVEIRSHQRNFMGKKIHFLFSVVQQCTVWGFTQKSLSTQAAFQTRQIHMINLNLLQNLHEGIKSAKFHINVANLTAF